jgi:hypothetical protein
MLKRIFSSFLYGYNMYGFDYLANYYSKVYYRAEKIRFSANRRFKQRKKDLFFLKHNYRYLFFLFSFLDFMAFKFNQSYPYKNFRRRTLTGMIKLFVF